MNQKVTCIHQQERCSEDDLKGMILLPFIQKKKKKKPSKNILTAHSSVTFIVDSDRKS